MLHRQDSLRYKLAALFLLMALIVSVLSACGKEKEKTPPPSATPVVTITPTPTVTLGPTRTSIATPTPTSAGPVKIGAITAWSGPAAISGIAIADPVIKLVEQQVKDAGGILASREVKIVKYDNRASVAEAQAGVKKLVLDDKVSAITLGGISGAEFEAVATAAEELKILYVSLGHIRDLQELKFTVNATIDLKAWVEATVNFINKVLKPKTVAFLAADTADGHYSVEAMKENTEVAGTKTVYEQYILLGTEDYSPYLTKIMYEKPDLLFLYSGQNEMYMSVAKQITELGDRKSVV